MSKTIPAQHPAVVLRSHYRQLRSLLAVLVVAVVGLTATVVVMTVDETRPPARRPRSIRRPRGLSDPFEARTQPTRDNSKPDESRTAAALAGHSEVGPAARARAYQEALRSMTPQQLDALYGIGK